MTRKRFSQNGSRFRITSVAALLAMIIFLSSMAAYTRGLPSGFISEVVSHVTAVTGAFAPHPKTGEPILLLVSKKGRVRVLQELDGGTSKDKLILDLHEKICTNGERGLQNLAIHPNFKENRYVYLFYTKFKDGCHEDKSIPEHQHPHNIIARFTMNLDSLMLDFDSRNEIWRGAPLRGYATHNGGAMEFGNDGKLYVTHGDAGTQDNAQDISTVSGSVLRLNDDGSTPDDNPFTIINGYDAYHCEESRGKVPVNASSTAVCSEIFSYGVRNPFRMAIDPNEKEKVRFSIQDVGARTWEELSYGGTDYAGMDYGWKPYEGPCVRHSSQECPAPEESNLVEPFHYYIHRSDKSGCVSGAAFVPEGLWPEEYTFLFADFVFYEVYSLTDAPGNECRTCSPPISRFKNETFFEPLRYPGEGKNQGRVVDLFFGPYKDSQALYVITYGNIETVHRIRYTGVHKDPPFVNFTVSKQNIDLNEEVQFDGSTSYDPEGDEISYQWFFGDDTQSTMMKPTHSYDRPGKYKVTLFVTDSINQVQQRLMFIFVGDPPVAEILSPAEGDGFYVGEVIQLVGKANFLNGTAFNDSQLQWEVRKHHDDHYHPFLGLRFGNNLSLSPAPEPEDFYASTNSYLEIILYATDDDGLTRKISRNVQPSLIEVGINSNLKGSNIEVNDEVVSTSKKVVSWKNQHVHLTAKSDSSYRFVSWTDGIEEKSRNVVLNYSDPIFTANFCALNRAVCSDQVVCCSGYCGRDMMDTSPFRNNSPQAIQNFSDSNYICLDTPSPTSDQSLDIISPTSARSARTIAPTYMPTKLFGAEINESNPHSTDEFSPHSPTESVASEFASINFILLAVSIAILLV